MNVILLMVTLLSLESAEKCYEGDVVVESATQLESLRSAQCISGDLHIKRYRVTNLNALTNLAIVEGDFF